MGIFNDFKQHYSQWNNCKSEALRRTIYMRPAQDATREDLIINHDRQADIEKELSRMKVKAYLEKAIYLSRAKGESYIIFLDNPKNDGLPSGKGSLNEFSRTIAVREKVLGGLGEKYITIDGVNVDVSEERIFKIEGDYDDRLKPISATHYVDDEINAYWDIIRSTLQILKKSSIHAMKIKDFDELLANAMTDDEVVALKATLDDMAKKLNNENAIFMDSGSSLESVSFSLSGIVEICNELRGLISGATLPELVLFDKSPQGLSSSRREQLEHYYSIIKSIQELQLGNVYDAIFKSVLASDYGDITYEFAPLDVMSNKEKAEIRAMNIVSADSIINNLNLSRKDALTVYQSLDIVDDLDIEIEEEYINPYEDYQIEKPLDTDI